ncbi:hypothetical protein Pth03_78480 [Planotetraspora thailandica]|uniref:DUF2273 domain-containing protein n=1 Tax=Planotetraspora thailandica TaxID=487172 RepID=A0A8J4DEU1_9ACTN|nr:hypothetical protein [Planotetraspora thailandica]GII59459.1 hypothetical protein Pth03_78480 [Planotetraspora thailandica]
MKQFPVWALTGLAFGTILGVVGAFGGGYAFLIVLVLGVLGLFIGMVMEGDVEMPAMRTRRQ